MSSLISSWFKRLFVLQASCSSDTTSSSNQSSIKNGNFPPSHRININPHCLLGETMTDRCIIVDQPSTMADADAMRCENEQSNNLDSSSSYNNMQNRPSRKDTIVVDKFKACFIDCTCQCEATKVIPRMNMNGCHGIKSQLLEELFEQIRDPSYELDCCCDCGKRGIRKLKFNYATGDKSFDC